MKAPPQLPGGLPFLGHALQFRRDPVGMLRRARERYGEIFTFRLAGKDVTVLSGPKANAAFFQAPEDQLNAREAYRFTVPIFGKGVAYDVSADVMDEQLGLVFPALRDQRLSIYARVMAEEAEAYFNTWGEEGEVDLLAVANELTVFIASRCLVGHEFRHNLSTEFAHLYHDLEGGINLLAFLHPHMPLPSFRRRDQARVKVGEMISRIIAERKAHGIEGEDFLDTLRQARYSDGSSLSDDAICGLLLTLIFAGQHTSAVLAAWTGVLLLQNPEYLPPILAEQEALFPDGAGMSLAAVRKMTVLERAVKEAERMHPPLIMLMRTILRDFEYAGYTSRAGGLALVSPAVSHRIPEIFRDPDRYDPGRFAPGREEDRQSPTALIGFGGGRHRCIGQTFAYQQVRVIWSVLLRRFDLELVQPEYTPDYSTFVVGPRRPCLVRYRRHSRMANPGVRIPAATGA